MRIETLFVGIFLVATAVALLARWLRVPYTVALVVAGIALGAAPSIPTPNLTKDLLYAVFLPGLLFEAAFHLEFNKFWKNKRAITTLAAPGLVVAILVTAFLMVPTVHTLGLVNGFGFQHGLLFAALLASTDPIAVVGLFKSLGVPKRLAVLVEGESLLNDGTAIVVFTLILGVMQGASFSIAHALVDFVRVVGVGLGIGLVVGYTASKALKAIDDPMIEITLTTLAAYGSFALAEHFHFSGVIATVAAGMLCGNYGSQYAMSPSTRIAVESFWEYVAFALNSAVFLLIGFTVRLPQLVASWKAILVAWFAVTLGRAAVVYLTSLALRKTHERVPPSWVAVLTWGGLRGGLSMVLALGLPESLPHRELIVTMTFGTVIISILVQGLTMGPLLRGLGLVRQKADRGRYELEKGSQQAALQALAKLDGMVRDRVIHADVSAALRTEYMARVQTAAERIEALHLETAELRAEERLTATRTLLLAEKDALLRAMRTGALSGDAAEHLLREVDERIVTLDDQTGTEH